MNPIATAYDYIFDRISSHSAVQAIVDDKNMLNLADRSIAAKNNKNPSTGDYPFFKIYPNRNEYNLHASSDLVTITKYFTIGVVTGDQQISGMEERFLLDIEFALLLAVYPLQGTIRLVEDSGTTFQGQFRIVDGQDQKDRPDMDRGSLGWVGVLTLEVVLYVPRSLFAAEVES